MPELPLRSFIHFLNTTFCKRASLEAIHFWKRRRTLHNIFQRCCLGDRLITTLIRVLRFTKSFTALLNTSKKKLHGIISRLLNGCARVIQWEITHWLNGCARVIQWEITHWLISLPGSSKLHLCRCLISLEPCLLHYNMLSNSEEKIFKMFA